MSYRIAQDYEYAGKAYWRWWAWIDANQIELDRVKEVVWILHPSFKQSRITTSDRSNQFRLETAGWGTFLLKAEVSLEGGDHQLLKHYLRLQCPKEDRALTETSQSNRPLTVFLSYGAQDTKAASKLRHSFTEAGFDVLDQTALHAGGLCAETMQRMISRSDAVVGFVGGDQISPWVRAEIEAAGPSGKPAFLLMAPGASNAEIPDGVRSLQVDASNFNPAQIAGILRSERLK